MILIQATIKYKGYDPDLLSKGSNKRICVSCDLCGHVRYVVYQAYRNLCGSCSKSGKGNPRYNKKLSKKTKEMIGKSNKDKKRSKLHCLKMSKRRGKLAPNWKGGLSNNKYDRSHVLPKWQCIKLNTYFKGSHFHHLNYNTGVYIPADLHRHIHHSFKSGFCMFEMNLLASQFIKGEL